ncbi:hypothetical protein CHUAL_010799 [Chamberlinius hualienensis]
MIYQRGNHRDFDNWSSSGNVGWNFSSVLPYFLKSEGNTIEAYKKDFTYHNSNGPLTISRLTYKTESLDAFLESGVESGYNITDCNGKSQTGFMPYALTMKRGGRWSSYDAYLKPASQRDNLVIFTNSFVTKILFDGNRAVGVVYQNAWSKDAITVTATKEVILSAGSIASPKILMLSGIGPADHLKEFNISVVVDLKGVGQNLHDHISCYAPIFSVNCTDCTYDLYKSFSFTSIVEYFLFGTGPLTVPYLSEGLGYMNTKYVDPNEDYPDIQMNLVSGNIASSYKEFQFFLGITNDVATAYFEPMANMNGIGISPVVMRPKSRGWVKLQSNDPEQKPLIDFNPLSHPDDIKLLVEGIKLAKTLADSPSLKKFDTKMNSVPVPGCETYRQFSDEYLECACRHLTWMDHHAVGTCKMGVSTDPLAVVDSNLKIHKVLGLRVVDASIMPTIPSGNTAASTFMIAEKISQEIKEEYYL